MSEASETRTNEANWLADKVIVRVNSTGAEHAASALTNTSTVTMLVLGY